MSAPIKPPPSAGPQKVAGELTPEAAERPDGAAAEAFDRVLNRVSDGVSGGVSDGVHTQGELGIGELGIEEVLDRLVHHTLGVAGALSAPRRAELESFLRASLSSDPTLLLLRKDLESRG